MSTLYVSIDDLKAVAQRLLSERDELINIYNSKVKLIIEASKDAIIVSSLDFNEVNRQFKTAFDNLSNDLSDLSNALTTQIIPQYENLDTSITKSFNSEFADKMRDIFKNGN